MQVGFLYFLLFRKRRTLSVPSPTSFSLLLNFHSSKGFGTHLGQKWATDIGEPLGGPGSGPHGGGPLSIDVRAVYKVVMRAPRQSHLSNGKVGSVTSCP